MNITTWYIKHCNQLLALFQKVMSATSGFLYIYDLWELDGKEYNEDKELLVIWSCKGYKG